MAKDDWVVGLLFLAGLYILGQALSKKNVNYFRCWNCNRILVKKNPQCPFCGVDISCFVWYCVRNGMVFYVQRGEDGEYQLSVGGRTEEPDESQMRALESISFHQDQLIEFLTAYRN